MTALWKYPLLALVLTLTSCATYKNKGAAYLPPRVECGQYEPPVKRTPVQPGLAEKSLIIWQLYAFAIGDYAESLLEQRIATAACMEQNREAGIIR